MKRLFLVLVSVASTLSTFAQDVIVKRDGEEIQCKILEVSTNKVKFKQWKNQNGPTFVEKKTDILMLKYENGQKEVISYSGPVSESKIEETVEATVIDSVALADTMPISNDYLEYVRKEKSGLLMWGRSISEEKAHEIMGKDWTEFTRAHKSERVGRAMIFTGGALIVGGGVFTGLYIKASKDYNDKESAYNNHWNEANANYAEKVNNLYDSYKTADAKKSEAQNKMEQAQETLNEANEAYIKASELFETAKKNYKEESDLFKEEEKNFNAVKKTFDNAQTSFDNAKSDFNKAEETATKAYDEYNAYDNVDNRAINFANFYNPSFKDDMNDAKKFKKATLYPMIGCYASGAALLIWGLIKENRAHTRVNRIVNRHNAEDTPIEIELPTETSWKPEFDMEARENGLALLLKF